jgi:cell wall assembly regulator SMI1
MAILLSEFWGKNHYNHPPLTNDMILEAENSLNVKLPPLLVDLLQIQNGGYTKGFVFPMKQRTSWASDHVPLDALSGIITDPSHRTAQNILDTEYMTTEWDLPAKQILLAGDGHWWITLDYRNGNEPQVRWLDVDSDEDIEIAASFDDFINGLISVSDFEV